MKVLFLTNVPVPYRVSFFNELGKKCDLTVLFEKSASDERDDSWKQYSFINFKGILLKGKSVDVDSAVCLEVVKYLDGGYDEIVVTDFWTPTGMIAIQYMRLKGIKYWLESDGGTPKDGKGIKERIKRYFVKNAKGYFSTSQEHDRFYVVYGADPHKIVRYPFTSLECKDILPEIPPKSEKDCLRRKLGLYEKSIIITVGRFSYMNGFGKGYDAVLRAASQLSHDYGWYIVGGQPTEEFKKMTADMELQNVHYVDFMSKEALIEYYKAADLFVLMTVSDVWGLVINEAMACGLPVITTDKCAAGVELVTDGENGYLVSVGDDKALAQRAGEILNSQLQMETMGNASLKRIKNYTIEKMAEKHMEVFGEKLGE